MIDSYAQRYLKPVFTSVNINKNITYGSAMNYGNINQSLLLDFYEPAGDTKTQRPLIIYIHGGGFTDVNQTKTLTHIVAFCDSFALRGYAVASIDYRIDSAINNRAIINAMHDARAAVRFFKTYATTYKIDTAQIFIGGESAGAITSLNVNYITETKEVLYPPVAPYSKINTIEGGSGNAGYSSKTKATLCFCGGTKTASYVPVFDTNAIKRRSDPPLLQLHGTSDPIIPVQYALEVGIRARNIGVPGLFYPLYGATHCPWFYPLKNSWAYLDTLVRYTASFLYAGLTTGIPNISMMKGHMKVYPNPAKNKLYIELENIPDKVREIKILNLLGETVLCKSMGNNSELVFTDYNLLAGIYFVQLVVDGYTISNYKLIIEN
jgi:para-nitrobenzyl esterase